MNTKIVALSSPSRQYVRIRTKNGLLHFRRMWGGIAWPSIPNPGAVCVVGEEYPEREDAEYGNMILLDQAEGRTIDGLLRNTIAMKDIYCVTYFYADPRNEALFESFKSANGLTRYKKDSSDDWKILFPFFKDDWLTAGVEEASQADNPEYGLQLIHDWLYGDGRLKIEKTVKSAFEEGKILPITKEMLKTGIPPVIDALRHVLAAYYQKPFFPKRKEQRGGSLGNWFKKGEQKKPSSMVWYVD